MTTRYVRFGDFRFDPAANILLCAGRPVLLGRRQIAILAALLNRRGEVLTKEDLLDAAWPDEIVEPSNLSVQMALLRRQIAGQASGGSWIATVERVGYRFLPDLTEVQVQGRSSLPTVAVLPFADLSGEPASAGAADCLVADLCNALARNASVSVISSLSGVAPQGRLGRTSPHLADPGARFVIEGNVRRAGDGFRVTAQLLDRGDGVYVSAHALDTPAGPATVAQDFAASRLTAWVVSEIETAEMRRCREERPEGESSRDLYLRARFLLQASRRESHAAAYALLRRALKLEPDNVTIIAAACEALHHAITCGWLQLTADDRAESLALANRGLRLGGRDATAMGLIAITLFSAHQPDLGAAVMERAIETNLTSPLALISAGLCNLCLNRDETAEHFYERVLELGPQDPNRKFALTQLAHVARRRGDYDTAIALATRSLAINQALSPTYWDLISCNALLGHMAAARRYLAMYDAVNPGMTIARVRRGQSIGDPKFLAPLLEGLWLAGMPEQ